MTTTEQYEGVAPSNVREGDRLQFMTRETGFNGRGLYTRTGVVAKVTEKTVRVDCRDSGEGTAVLRRDVVEWHSRDVRRIVTEPADQPGTYDEELPAAVTEAAAGAVVITQDGDRPQYNVWLDQQHIGSIFDETGANLARGDFAAWSPKGDAKNGHVGFYASKEEAGDAIGRLYRPAGPRGTTEPHNRNDRFNFQALPADRQAKVTAHAARLHAEGGRTVARCWRDALNADWRDNITTPDEDTLRMCVAVNGGEIHTAAHEDEGEQVWPLCRSMAQNSRLTKYRFVDAGDLTCRTCLGYREGRAAARARKAARA